MRLDKRRLILILLLMFIVSITMVLADQQKTAKDNVVADFQVEDAPADDGTGLVLSWKPLDRSKRVIEYRVYRGVNPDTLFFLDYIQVNPKSGVTAERMYYYDSSPSEISDINFPRKLKHEKGQPADGILYDKPPRYLDFTANYLKHFRMLTRTIRKNFYYRSKEVFVDEEGTQSFAGLKYNQQTVLASLKPGIEYFYAVVAVDERRQMLPRTEVASGVPVPNAPEAAAALHSVILEDSGELLFEWDYPIVKSNLNSYEIMELPAFSEEVWEELKQDPMYAGKIIASGAVGGGALKNYTSLKPESGIEAFKDKRFAIRFTDYYGASSLSEISKPRILDSDCLPNNLNFWVEDKPNDKGDKLSVVWDHPIAFITKCTSLNRAGTRLRINYQLNKTENQEINTLWFEFSDPENGEVFVKVKEFYLDDSINIRLPKGYDIKKGLRVKIAMEGEPEIPKDYLLEQNLEYDEAMLALLPDKSLYRNGRDVSKIYNMVYRKYMNSPHWRQISRNTSFDNSLDVTIPYPKDSIMLVRGISYAEGDSMIIVDMDGERSARLLRSGESRAARTLLDHKVDFVWDEENETLVRTSIFANAAQKMQADAVNELELKLEELKSELEESTEAEETEAIESKIAATKKKLSAYNSDVVSEAFAAKSNRQRLKKVLKAQDGFNRNQAFMVVRTDARGLFMEAEPKMLSEGKYEYYFPISNGFDTNKIVTLIATLLFFIIVVSFVQIAKSGRELYIRPIAGLQEIDNAIGRATEMGRPVLYCMGHGGLSDVATIASMGILSLVAKRSAEYDTRLIVPCYDYIVLPIAQEIVREAHYSVGRPDTYDQNNVFYLTNVQFAYVAGVNGIMVREKVATNFFMGYFSAEALLMTETGNAVGAVQIAGTDAVTQIPFFITTCQYTLIGEELYAASAYLNREPRLLGNLKAQDYFKFIIVIVVLIGAVLASFGLTGFTKLLPAK